jgi:hypothetical protein
LTAWVAPAIVPGESVFARTVGPRNAAAIAGAYAGDVEMAGIGAGGDATAVAILSDILAIARDRAAIIPAPVLSLPQAILGIRNSEFGIWNSESLVRILNSEFRIPNSYAEAV